MINLTENCLNAFHHVDLLVTSTSTQKDNTTGYAKLGGCFKHFLFSRIHALNPILAISIGVVCEACQVRLNLDD